jgi:hypothetical protein
MKNATTIPTKVKSLIKEDERALVAALIKQLTKCVKNSLKRRFHARLTH